MAGRAAPKDPTMTDTPAPTTCWHPSIHVSRNEEHDITVWACEDCRRRFYPACEQCVSIGHREGHGEHIEARSTPAEPLDEAALRYAFHAAKWCKDGGPGHVMAHDDEDEDGIRARFIDAYEAARTGTVAVNEQGEELDPDD